MKRYLLLLACCLSGLAQAADVLHLYNWNNYLAPETAARFEAYCRCKLVQTYYADNEEMLAKLLSGVKGYDIIVPTGYALEPMKKQRMLRRLNKAALPNLKNINPDLLNTPFDPGNVYSVPYAFTTTVLG